MSKLRLLRTSITSNFSVRALRSHNRGFPSPLLLLRESPRCFSTESEQKQPTDPAVDSFLNAPETGLVYGRLYGSVTKNTLKTDIVNMLEGCNLRLEDVKVDYNRSLTPVQAIVQFSSPQAFEQAIRAVRSRPFRLDKADRSHWDRVSEPYHAKIVLLQGIPPNALAEDVERFLSGLEYDSSSIQMFYRLMSSSDRIRMATVRFPTTTEAMSAVIKKNRAFCLNNQITVRVLQ